MNFDGVMLGVEEINLDGVILTEGSVDGVLLGTLEMPRPPPQTQHASFTFLSK